MLLVFLNFNLDIGASRIGLIPSFLGYIFMLNGIAELTQLSGRFISVRPYIIIMTVYSGIFYIMDLLGVSAMISELAALGLGLLSTVMSLVISYHIVMGIREIESTKIMDLHAEKLYSTWKILAVFSLIGYVLLVIPVLAIVSMVAGLIVGIYYLYIFNQTKNLYYQQGVQ